MRVHILVRAFILALMFSAGVSLADDDLLKAGERIYSDGILASGESMNALVNGDVPIYGQTIVCFTCHRRSGMGLSEGPTVVPAVVGEILFNDVAIPTSRPPAAPVLRLAYTRESLARSIRDGIGPDGSALDSLMPVYPLSEQDMDALIAYLESLSIAPDPGVDDTYIHFATVIDSRVDPAARKALVDVLETYIGQKNTETRYESKRASSGPWHKDWIFKPYRKWVLHIWDVEGDPQSWPEQLAERYEAQPVFAMLNGISADTWAPVHEFCEAEEIPCLFPTTELPVADREEFFNMYLSRGVQVEAELVAEHLESVADGVVQRYDETNPVSLAAAAAFSSSSGIDQPPAQSSQGVSAGTTTVVAWMGADDIAALMPELPASVSEVYVSGTLLDAVPESLSKADKAKLRIVYSTERPDKMNRLLMRSTGWFRAKRINAPNYQDIQANAYFALKVAGGALVTIRGYFRREYFIESVEHMIDNANYTSVYPRLSLAPDQRFLSKGAQIARFSDDEDGRLVSVVEWTVPRR